MPFQILIQPVNVGNVGQHSANAINIVLQPFEITDTTIICRCNLINIISASNQVQVPDPWGYFEVPVSWPLNQNRIQLQASAQAAILTFPNPDFVLR